MTVVALAAVSFLAALTLNRREINEATPSRAPTTPAPPSPPTRAPSSLPLPSSARTAAPSRRRHPFVKAIHVYKAPIPPWKRATFWRFRDLLEDLDRLGALTDDALAADVFLIPHHAGISNLDSEAMIRHVQNINPRFTWANHFLMSPCDHGPMDCMFEGDQRKVANFTALGRLIHPLSRQRKLRFLMVSGSRQDARFNPKLDVRIPTNVHTFLRAHSRQRAGRRANNFTFYWSGSVRMEGIRADLLRYFEHEPGFYVRNTLTAGSKPYHVYMPTSRFCGSPPGWSGGDSDRYLPALVFGCIPVFFLDDEVLPFEEVINWDDVALRLTRKQIPSLGRILNAVTRERAELMQRNGPRVLDALRYTRGSRRILGSANLGANSTGAAMSLLQTLDVQQRRRGKT